MLDEVYCLSLIDIKVSISATAIAGSKKESAVGLIFDSISLGIFFEIPSVSIVGGLSCMNSLTLPFCTVIEHNIERYRKYKIYLRKTNSMNNHNLVR